MVCIHRNANFSIVRCAVPNRSSNSHHRCPQVQGTSSGPLQPFWQEHPVQQRPQQRPNTKTTAAHIRSAQNVILSIDHKVNALPIMKYVPNVTGETTGKSAADLVHHPQADLTQVTTTMKEQNSITVPTTQKERLWPPQKVCNPSLIENLISVNAADHDKTFFISQKFT